MLEIFLIIWMSELNISISKLSIDFLLIYIKFRYKSKAILGWILFLDEDEIVLY